MKINKVLSYLKNKAFPAFLAASTLATGLAITGCGTDCEKPKTPQEPQKPPIVVDNDKDKELTDAISALNKFMSTAKEGKNFTIVSECANNQTYTYYADTDKLKIEYDDSITYIVSEEYTLYRVFQAEDNSWHKDVADEWTKDGDATIASFIAKVNAISWSEYDSQAKRLRYELNNESATVKLETGKITVSFIVANDSGTFTLQDVGTTAVILPENILDDTQQVTPPPQLTEEQKQAIIVQNVYRVVESKLDILGKCTIDKIIAMDFENNEDNKKYYTYLFLQITYSYGTVIDLIKIPMATPMTIENIMKEKISTNDYDAESIFTASMTSILQTSNDETSKSIFDKLKSENLVPDFSYDIIAYSAAMGQIDVYLGCPTDDVHFYALSKRGLLHTRYFVKSADDTTNTIKYYLINGTLNKTFHQIGESFYHAFTDSLIYDLTGLQYLPEE